MKYSRICFYAFIFILIGIFSSSCGYFLSSREKVEVLRNQGFGHLLKKEFEEAAYYYIAALTLSQQDDERLVNDRALYNYGLLFSTWERYASTMERLEDQLLKHKRQENRPGIIIALADLGEVYIDWGKYAQALEFFEKSLVLAEEEGDWRGQCRALNYIGKALIKLEDYDGAPKYFFHLRDLALKREMNKYLSDAYLGIGYVWNKKEKKEKAEANYLLALTTSQKVGYSEGEEKALEALGRFFLKENKNRLALSYFIPALSLKQDVVDQRGSGRLWRLIADVYFQWGKNLLAQRGYAEAFRIRFEIKDFYKCSILLRKLGRVYLKMKKYKEALYYYNRSRLFFRTLGYLNGESQTLLEIAQLYTAQNNFDKALGKAKHGLKISIDIEDRVKERDFREFIARLYVKKGKIKKAIKEMKKVVEIDEEIKSDQTRQHTRFLMELVDAS
jgi:tetratricopeptide (TPR) repeat protein